MTTNQQIKLNADHQWSATTGSKPTPKANELLIKVQASSINPVDLKRRAITTTILGYDGYGTVQQVGAAVTTFHPGDVVFYAGSTQINGSFQHYQCIPAAICAIAPSSISATDSAGLPLVSLTAYELLFEKLGFTAQPNANQGQHLLIINGAGGVGSILSQLAKWAGLTVSATSSPSHFDWLTANGADHCLDYHSPSKHANLAHLPNNHFDSIAVLYDIEHYLPTVTRLIKPFGQIGTIVGNSHPLDLAPLKAKSASFSYEYMFTKTDYQFQTASQGAILRQIAQLIDTQILHPITTAHYNGLTVTNLQAITDTLLSSHTVGKQVLLY
ncbi:alcohol dehydrogenase catalytic domain-containing protein [Latilactobacillus graminis]|uniref:Zinc-containing alcohol dehydrogenase(Oxidoreductase) n=2 Tax=Latilactobacillus graminis TaxID=60519 RepID=A0AA89KY74_9LACO|nr:zinc-binding dehydrogenase [Latilactobacillus graminis]KRM24149.1 zinc-containing alcohol dehydrogenase(oxidoreductase) [Latilactobacillus graminis DSM 20719]QFP78864.1 zinc-binding dehydrogenase [Latilactobacillus graminis]